MKILIATTNPGKFTEIVSELGDLPFDFVNLKTIRADKTEPDEPFDTTWENALHKARYYAKKYNLVTIADDAGIFVKFLGDWPGVRSKQSGNSEKERVEIILTKLKGVPLKKRAAYFLANACIYDPKYNSCTLFQGKVAGFITESITAQWKPGLEHDSIFFHPPSKKTFVEMSSPEKNMVSHRGQVLRQLKHYLSRQYGFFQFMVPVAIVVKNRKMLILKRRDNRPAFNNKWELPGGGVDNGETIEECVHREVKEETGFTVKILTQIPGIPTAVRKENNYQVFLVFFVAEVIRGTLKFSPNENSEAKWVGLKELFEHDQIPLNKKFLRDNLNILRQYID